MLSSFEEDFVYCQFNLQIVPIPTYNSLIPTGEAIQITLGDHHGHAKNSMDAITSENRTLELVFWPLS